MMVTPLKMIKIGRVIFVPVIFSLATLWLYFLATSYAPHQEDDQLRLHFPSSISELKEITVLLLRYRQQHSTYIFLLFVSAYLYKQTFAIPGSVFMNVLAGTLFGLQIGLPLVCLLSALGASCCFLLSKHFGQRLVEHFFSEKILALQKKVEENNDCLLIFLLFVRVFPMSPNWFINMASPILNVPIHVFFVSVLFGLVPYNFICVQAGVILSEIQSLDDIFTYGLILKFLLIATALLVPSVIIRRRQKIQEMIDPVNSNRRKIE